MLFGKMSEKGWVVIPKELRRRYGFKQGARVAFVEWEGHLYLVPVPDDPVASLHGMLASPDVSMTEELLRERQLESDREEAKVVRWGKPSASRG
jgi:AbrB family looped-hinge helix DNA binding protein